MNKSHFAEILISKDGVSHEYYGVPEDIAHDVMNYLEYKSFQPHSKNDIQIVYFMTEVPCVSRFRSFVQSAFMRIGITRNDSAVKHMSKHTEEQ